MAGIDGMAQRTAAGDCVAVTAPGPRSCDVASLDKVSQDLLCGTLRHPHLGGEVTDPDVRVTRDGKQNMRVVGKKRPPRVGGRHRVFP